MNMQDSLHREAWYNTSCEEQQFSCTNPRWCSYGLYVIQMIRNYFETIEDEK